MNERTNEWTDGQAGLERYASDKSRLYWRSYT